MQGILGLQFVNQLIELHRIHAGSKGRGMRLHSVRSAWFLGYETEADAQAFVNDFLERTPSGSCFPAETFGNIGV